MRELEITSGDVGVAFESKHPHDTLCLRVEHPEGERPSLIDALREVGWFTESDRGRAGLPPLGGVATTTLSRPGTGLFTGWTAEEARRFEPEARAILAGHGHDDVPHYELTLAELL